MIKGFVKYLVECAGFEVTRITTDDITGQSIMQDLAQLARGKPVDMIFDVGANVGDVAQAFAAQFPLSTVHCFEPAAATFRRLTAAVQGQRRIVPHHMALGREDGTATLHLNRDCATNSLLPNAGTIGAFADNAPAVQPIGTEAATVCRLDTFCSQQRIASIDILKMDTQGYELAVLEGAGELLSDYAIRFVYLEVLFVPLYEGQAEFGGVYDLLRHASYQLVGLYGGARSPQGYLKWCDALFMSPKSK